MGFREDHRKPKSKTKNMIGGESMNYQDLIEKAANNSYSYWDDVNDKEEKEELVDTYGEDHGFVKKFPDITLLKSFGGDYLVKDNKSGKLFNQYHDWEDEKLHPVTSKDMLTDEELDELNNSIDKTHNKLYKNKIKQNMILSGGALGAALPLLAASKGKNAKQLLGLAAKGGAAGGLIGFAFADDVKDRAALKTLKKKTGKNYTSISEGFNDYKKQMTKDYLKEHGADKRLKDFQNSFKQASEYQDLIEKVAKSNQFDGWDDIKDEEKEKKELTELYGKDHEFVKKFPDIQLLKRDHNDYLVRDKNTGKLFFQTGEYESDRLIPIKEEDMISQEERYNLLKNISDARNKVYGNNPSPRGIALAGAALGALAGADIQRSIHKNNKIGPALKSALIGGLVGGSGGLGLSDKINNALSRKKLEELTGKKYSDVNKGFDEYKKQTEEDYLKNLNLGKRLNDFQNSFKQASEYQDLIEKIATDMCKEAKFNPVKTVSRALGNEYRAAQKAGLNQGLLGIAKKDMVKARQNVGLAGAGVASAGLFGDAIRKQSKREKSSEQLDQFNKMAEDIALRILEK